MNNSTERHVHTRNAYSMSQKCNSRSYINKVYMISSVLALVRELDILIGLFKSTYFFTLIG